MSLLATTWLFLVQICLCSILHLQPRIVDNPTTHNEYPYMVSLRIYSNNSLNPLNEHICSGTLIKQNPVTVLTAARCKSIFDKKAIQNTNISYALLADIGRTQIINDNATDFETFKLTQIKIHPNYTQLHSTYNDVAVLFFDGLSSKPSLNNDLYKGDSSFLLRNNETLRVISYGIYKGPNEYIDTLQYSEYTIVNKTVCNISLLFTTGWICGASSGYACSITDIGGPALFFIPGVTKAQMGILSIGYPTCSEGSLNVFTDVGLHYDWIWNTVNAYKLTKNETVDKNVTDIPENVTKTTSTSVFVSEDKTDEDSKAGIIIGSVIGAFFLILIVGMIIMIILNSLKQKSGSQAKVYEDINTDVDTDIDD